MQALFWLCVVGSVYSYFIYPLLLSFLPKRRRTDTVGGHHSTAFMSLIITAHNEQARIREKLENSLLIDYPRDQFEIIVASDCSTDGTDALVDEYAVQGVRLVRADVHQGKEYAQSLAIAAARGGILVFSDVSTQIPPNAFKVLETLFADAQMGAVSSEDRFVSPDGEIAGEGLYVRYEMWLRKLESQRAGLVGLSGSFFAARREVCKTWDIQVPSDFNTALNCRVAGYRAVSDARLVGIYKDIKDPAQEYQRKVRTIVRGLQALLRKPEVLNPLLFGRFAFQVWSHKVMRWAVPWFMLLVFVLSALLAGQYRLYDLILRFQLLLYAVMLAALIWPGLRQYGLVRIPFYFLQANIAIAHATLAFAGGRRITTWKPSAR